MAEAKTKRYRLTVPVEDRDVIAWLAAQANASWSMRLLIRKQIKSEGITDATCGPVVPRANRTGRPSKAAVAAMDQALADIESGAGPEDYGGRGVPTAAAREQYPGRPQDPAPVPDRPAVRPQAAPKAAPVAAERKAPHTTAPADTGSDGRTPDELLE